MTSRVWRSDALAAKVERWFAAPVLVAALLVVPVIVIEESAKSDGWRALGTILNWAIWGVFAAEFGAGLATTRNRGRWLRTHLIELTIVVVTPPFLPASLQAARLVRLLRLVRLARLAQLGPRVFSLNGVKVAAFLALLAVLGGGAAFVAAEQGHHPGDGHLTTWDGVWWATGTMSTVGSGDLSAATTAGRVITIAVIVVGLGFVAILTAALAQRFAAHQLHAEVASAERAIVAEVDSVEADLLPEVQKIRRRLEELERMLTRASRPRQPL